MEVRKYILNEKDIISFNNVPQFIIDSFFGKCNYKNRLLVSTFCYLNGIAIDQLFELVQWTDTSKQDKEKIRHHFYTYFKLERYQQQYYSFNVHHGSVMYLNGDLRRFGSRVPKKKLSFENQHVSKLYE